jgi:uncharacterized damage-inducible protein DinB
MMSEVRRIADQLRRTFEGDAWHGPSVRELLADVTARRAAAKPIAQAHSIWEIALHMATWDEVVRRRLAGEITGDLPAEVDWPMLRETSEDAWRKSVQDLEQSHRALCEAVARLDDARLAESVPGKPDSVYIELHGIVQHDLYHAGQIALLKKAQS